MCAERAAGCPAREREAIMDILFIILEILGSAAFAVSGVMVARNTHMDVFGAAVLGFTTACGGGLLRDLVLGQIPPSLFLDPAYAALSLAVSLVTFLIIYQMKPGKGEESTGTDIQQRDAEPKGLTCRQNAAGPDRAAGQRGTASIQQGVSASAGAPGKQNAAAAACVSGQQNTTAMQQNAAAACASGRRRAASADSPTAFDAALSASDSIGLAAFVVVGYQAAEAAGFGANGFLCVFSGVITGIGGGILRDILAGQMPLVMKKHIYGLAAVGGGLLYLGLRRASCPYIFATLASMGLTCLIRFLAIRYRWNLPRFR